MSLLLAEEPVKTSHFRISERIDILAQIQRPGINLCVWQRGFKAAWQKGIDVILRCPRSLSLDLTAPTGLQIAEYIGHFCATETQEMPSLSKLGEDIACLADRFGKIAGVAHPRVRLTRVEDDGCALFHADTLSLRLLCTYAGPGTQWLGNDNVRRHELGFHGRSLEEATHAIVIDPLKILTLPKSHVAIFKGRLAEGEENNALVHRSAPVRRPSDTRIRLCIDLPDSCTC